MKYFSQENFDNGLVIFKVYGSPPSVNSKNARLKKYFKDAVHDVTGKSEFIITGTCYISINYRCRHVTRKKNPGIYDMDNIIKPILDNLVGIYGLLVDDVLLNSVSVNWQDTQEEEHFEVEIEYTDLLYERKTDLILLKSKSGWCFPISRCLIDDKNFLAILSWQFSKWDSILSENDYYKNIKFLPAQCFIYHAKIIKKGYEIIDMPHFTDQLF